MRLALLGAFPFPFPQGSQIFAAQQAGALASAGAEPLLITYGRGRDAPPTGLAWRGCPAWISPRAFRSGPSWAKPGADLALLQTYIASHREAPFHAALAHNAEAAMVAFAARRLTGVPVVYVAHTLLRFELSAYGPASWASRLDAAGSSIDRHIARRADAIVALCEDARQILEPIAGGSVRVIPPGLDPEPAPAPEQQRELCRRLHLEPGAFALYSGNLDGYQEIELLKGCASQLAFGRQPLVMATHDLEGARALETLGVPGLRAVGLASFDDMRTLTHSAGAVALTRRRRGGFPVKLLNYMEARRAVVAHRGIACGLHDGESAILLPRSAGPEEWAGALRSLLDDPARAGRLGAAARARLEERHAWPSIAAETLALVEEVAAS